MKFLKNENTKEMYAGSVRSLYMASEMLKKSIWDARWYKTSKGVKSLWAKKSLLNFSKNRKEKLGDEDLTFYINLF